MKICSICRLDKQDSDFYSRNGKLRASCRQCDSIKAKNKYWSNEEYRNSKNAKRRASNTQYPYKYRYRRHQRSKVPESRITEVYEKYNSQCDLCQTTEHLTIHHIDGRGAYWSKRTGEIINNELSNLQLLCRNCHGAIDGGKNRKISDEKIFLIKELHKKKIGEYEISRLLNIPVYYVAYWKKNTRP